MDYLKQRIDISCDENYPRKKSEDKERIKYGVNHNSDTWGMDYILSAIIVNALLSFINKAEQNVTKENSNFYKEAYECAMSIKKYRENDEYKQNEKYRTDFEKAMKWLTNNFDNLWW